MTHTDNFLTPVEKKLKLKGAGVSDIDFMPMREIFDSLPTVSFKMCENDLAEVLELLPNIDASRIAESEVKPADGLCRKCGRAMNLLDIVHSALKSGTHSSGFVEHILGGYEGNLVIVGYQSPDDLNDEIKRRLPENTIFVEDAGPIPCKTCGVGQEVVLYIDRLMHFWVQPVRVLRAKSLIGLGRR